VLTVVIVNSITGDRETLTLTETGNATGIFRGCIPNSTSSGLDTEDGTLYALAGDIIVVTYDNPGFSPVTDTAPITVPTVVKPL
jgi:hypothetical protein